MQLHTYTIFALFLSLFWGINKSEAQCPSSFSCLDCQAFSSSQYEYCGNLATATYYWVGQSPTNPSGDFSAPCNWRIGSRTGKIPCQPPVSTNDVVFETAAFASATGASAVVSVTVSSNCKNYTWIDNATTLANPSLVIQHFGDVAQILDVYGSMTLISPTLASVPTAQMLFRHGGTINFRSIKNGTETITSNGQRFYTNVIDFIGGATTTEFLLTDNLYQNDAAAISNEFTTTTAAVLSLTSGKLNTNGKNLRLDYFRSTNGNTTRSLDIRNSRIDMWGYTNSLTWYADFVLTSAPSGTTAASNMNSFQAAGSYIKFNSPNNGWATGFCGGRGSGVQYATVEAPSSYLSTTPNAQSIFYIRGVSNTANNIEGVWIQNLILSADMNYVWEGVNVVADNLVLYANTQVAYNRNSFLTIPALITDNVTVVGGDCQNLVNIYGIGGSPARIFKKSAGTLNLQYAILRGIEATQGFVWQTTNFGAGARIHNATATKNAGGNITWDIIDKTPCAGGLDRANGMYFHNHVDAASVPALPKTVFWHDAQNWYNCTNCPSATPNFVPAGRVPNVWDDVFFDNLSFMITVGAYPSWVVVQKPAFCNDLRFLDDIVAPRVSAGILLPTITPVVGGNNGLQSLSAQRLNVYGDFLLSSYNTDSKVRAVTGGDINLWGEDDDNTNKDTIITGFAPMVVQLNLQPGAWYENYGNSRIQFLNGISGSRFHSKNCTLKINQLYLSQRELLNTQVYLAPPNSGYAFADNGGFDFVNSYRGTTAFTVVSSTDGATTGTAGSLTTGYFAQGAVGGNSYYLSSSSNYTFSVNMGTTTMTYYNAVNLPNFTSNRMLGVFNTSQGYWGSIGDVVLHGNAVFNENAVFQSNSSASSRNYYAQIAVLSHAADPAADRLVGTGNLTFYKGKEYIFSRNYTTAPNLTSSLYVEGNFTSVGTCTEQITMRTDQNSLIPIKILGASNVQYTLVNRFDNTGNPTIIASNSVNGFNGAATYLNWDFSGTAGTTYYWRRHQTTNSTVGNWSNPCHWTTTQANTVGDCACLPNSNDIVVFDNLSGINVGDSCKIDGNAYCKELHIYHQTVGIANPVGTNGLTSGSLYIANTLSITSPALTRFTFNGEMHFNGSGAGTILTGGTTFRNYRIEFAHGQGVWTLADDFRVSIENPSISSFRLYGLVDITEGRLNTNNKNVHIENGLQAISNKSKYLDLGNSTIYLYGNGWYPGYNNLSYPWYIGSNFITVAGASATIVGTSTLNTSGKYYYFGNTNAATATAASCVYGNVSISLPAPTTGSSVYGNYFAATNVPFNNVALDANFSIAPSNSIINNQFYITGNNKYIFTAAQVLNLRSGFPGGKIIRDNTSNFIDLESSSTANAFFRKIWGEEICLDYIKVRNIQAYAHSQYNPATQNVSLTWASSATASATTTIPTATVVQANDSRANLRFFAGTNCDNVNGTATGLWNFSLGFSNNTVTVPNMSTCIAGQVVTVTIPILGDDLKNYVYYYTWQGFSSPTATGTSAIMTALDPDQDGTTPYNYTVTMTANFAGTLTMYVAAERCGLVTPYATSTGYVSINGKNTVPNSTTKGSCLLNNDNFYVDIYDDLSGKPMVAILDNTGAGDASALGVVNVTTTISSIANINTANYGLLGTRPRMGRRWQIAPANNVTSGSGKAARVRLYFTRQELDALIPYTNNGWINATTEIEVWKYPDTQYDMVAPERILHTARAVTSNNWTTNVGGYPADRALLSTTDIICLEFDVTSFSHFVIVPTMNALLSTDLLGFNARADQSKRQVYLNWEIENNEQKLKYVVERSANGIDFAPVLEQTATAENGKISYQNTDFSPLQGGSYYRLRVYHRNGNETLSDIRQVSLEGTNIVNVYPVPASANTDLNIDISTSQAGEIRLSVIDMIGRTVLESSQMAGQGVQTLQMPLRQLASGTYKLKIVDNTGRVVQKTFLVQ